MSRRQRRRLIISSAIVLGVVGVLSALFLSGRFAQAQRQTADLLFHYQAANPDVSRSVVIVAIDDKSVVELRSHGRLFVWPRSFYGKVVDEIAAARPRPTIAFDVLFDSPGEGDQELLEALERARGQAVNVIMPMAGDPLYRHASAGRLIYDQAFAPLPAFQEAVAGLGMVDQLPDVDGTIRRVPLTVEVDGQRLPSFPLLAVSKFLRRPEPWDGPIENGRLPLAGRSVPIDRDSAMIVNYAGGPYESAPRAFTVVSFVDVMNGLVPRETFGGKIVLIGVTATAFADDYWTPTSVNGKMDGVEIHANAVDTLMRSEFLQESPAWMTLALIFFFALLSATGLLALPPLIAAAAAVLCLGVFVVGVSSSFDNGGLVLNLIYPPLSLFLTYGLIILYRVIFEQAEIRALRGVMGRYLSPSVVAEVTRDPDTLKLGGDQREMTVLFSDLRGFTSFSESLDPETLVQTLTEYLTAMSDVIFRHEGTIDKYMGDAVMAFWNAPQRQENHAELACLAALDMVRELEKLNHEWGLAGRKRLSMGIGINTGTMKVGNMGSATRFDYTVMGDAVNLGSRLEGLNKEYGTTVVISESTLKAAGERFHTRFLDLVAVKGKKEPVAVYELRVPEDGLGEHAVEAIRAYNEGIAAYQERDWLGAAARFQEALRFAPNDGPSALYLQRCERLMADPPPADWDGVYVMTHK